MSRRDRAFGIVGTGAVAHAFTRALTMHAGEKTVVWGRDEAGAKSVGAVGGGFARRARSLKDLCESVACVVIAVSDSAIDEVAGAVADAFPEDGGTILHTSGATTGAAAMPSVTRTDVFRGSVHPLVAVRPDTKSFEGLPFAVEGEGTSDLQARVFAQLLGGVPIELPAGEGPKRRYHALATMVATGVVALVERAARELETDGANRDELRRAYAQLARTAAENVERASIDASLTGAVARRDEALIASHLEALEGRSAEATYRAMVDEARRMFGNDAG